MSTSVLIGIGSTVFILMCAFIAYEIAISPEYKEPNIDEMIDEIEKQKRSETAEDERETAEEASVDQYAAAA